MWDVDTDTGCWLWAGAVTAEGYPVSRHGRRLAHRMAYEEENRAAILRAYPGSGGRLPASVQLDHRCRRRRCVNPDHLVPVTPRENALARGRHRREEWTRCPRGHELTGANRLTTPEGGILCRACMR